MASRPATSRRRSALGKPPVHDNVTKRIEKHNNCDVCTKLPYRGKELVVPLIADEEANGRLDIDAGIYEYIYRMNQKVVSDRVDEATVKKTMERCARHIRKLQAELAKAGILQKENQRYSGDDRKARMIAPFEMEEMRLGALLGNGGFSSVYEIASFRPDPDLSRNVDPNEQKAREHLARTCTTQSNSDKWKTEKGPAADPGRHGTPKYAVKHLRIGLTKEPERFERAAIDLVLEAQLLLCMDHPNILSMRGWSAQGVNGFRSGRHTSFFVIVDRLPETLEDRILKWRGDVRKYRSRIKLPWSREKYATKLDKLLQERLQVGQDIASALKYMHSKRIINRDVKSNNVGFDFKGELKLFDFGLSRLLPNKKEHQEDSYLMSRVGTKYYMAPEVRQKIPYNVSADVYSFGVCLWEILAMGSPREALRKYKEEGGGAPATRCPLPICQCWPNEVRNLVASCLSIGPMHRPSISEVRDILDVQLERLGRKRHGLIRRRSSLRLNLSGADATSQASSDRPSEYGNDSDDETKEAIVAHDVANTVSFEEDSVIDNTAARLPRTTDSVEVTAD